MSIKSTFPHGLLHELLGLTGVSGHAESPRQGHVTVGIIWVDADRLSAFGKGLCMATLL